MSSRQNSAIEEIVRSEEKLIDIYSSLEEQAAQQNVKMFLEAFSKGHEGIVSMIRENSVKHSGETGVVGRYRHIHATDHLSWKRQIDLGNLQSVLLFITKNEAESLREFDRIAQKNQEEKSASVLEKIRAEKSALAAKADRLYFDLIESKVS